MVWSLDVVIGDPVTDPDADTAPVAHMKVIHTPFIRFSPHVVYEDFYVCTRFTGTLSKRTRLTRHNFLRITNFVLKVNQGIILDP